MQPGGYGKFVNAHYARFTNSNAKLWLCLCVHLDFLPSLPSGKKMAIRPRAFIRPYINQYCSRNYGNPSINSTLH